MGNKLPHNFQKWGGGLTGFSFIEWGCWEKRGKGDFFQGVAVFTEKTNG